MNKALRIHPSDNIIVALHDLDAGENVELDGQRYTIAEPIPAKHKFAAIAFAQGDTMTLYGVTVGKATQAIPLGGRIHTSNIVHAQAKAEIRESNFQWTPPNVERWKSATFNGYHRADGSVGTANYWIVVPLVFCENRNLAIMKDAFVRQLGYDFASPYEQFVRELANTHRSGGDLNSVPNLSDSSSPRSANPFFPNVDGIKFLSHSFGCGHSDSDAKALAQLLAGYITNPNVAGATVLSLGCQKTQIDDLKTEIEKRDHAFSKPVYYFEQQNSASEKEMLSDAIRQTFQGLVEANELQRKPAPLSKLVLGLECGGSDGFSGITANPMFGEISDRLAAIGGSAILAEFPELCGVEQNMVDRSVDTKTAGRFLELMRLYAESAAKVGSALEHNPSPGNIADGLTTDAIKSAGAARKGGTSPVCDVLDYTDKATKPGLSLLCTPGNDVESTTALTGSGTNLIVFSTGLGTPTGNPICPVIKVSTNSTTANKLSDIIDFNAGGIIDEGRSIEEVADELMDMIIETASGRYKPHAVRLGQEDFIPWRRGVSL